MSTHDLLSMGIPVGEKIIRTVAVYGGLAVLLRAFGKRDLAQLNSFDLVVMLLLSNVVQNAVIGPDNSLVGGLLGAVVLVVVNSAVVRAVNRSPAAIAVFEGRPSRLVRDGRLDIAMVRRLGLRSADVEDALHRQGADSLDQVREAVLEPGGTIVVRQNERDQSATKGDLAALERRLVAAMGERAQA